MQGNLAAGSRTLQPALYIVLLLLLVLAPLHAQATPATYQYSGCVEGAKTVTTPTGPAQVPYRICFIVTLGEGETTVKITSVTPPGLLSAAEVRLVVGEAVRTALSRALDFLTFLEPLEDEKVVYVRGDTPVVCREVYMLSSAEMIVHLIPGDGGFIPVYIEGAVDDFYVYITLAYTDDPDACGEPLLTPGKRLALEAGVAATVVGAIAASVWRARSLRFLA